MELDSKPLDTMILVGGKGTRLQGIVNGRPKPMAEVAGRPFVEWLLMALKAQRIRRIIFCTGYLSEVIEAHFHNGKQWGMEIVYSRDPTPLGTGGAVRHGLSLVFSDRFLVMNGDSYCSVDIKRLEEMHLARGARASLWVVPVEDSRRYGSVTIAENGIVQVFQEKTRENRVGLISAGIYLLEREVVELMPEGLPFSLETDFFPRLIGYGLYAVVGEGPFIDIGTPEAYAKANRFFAQHVLNRQQGLIIP